MQQSRFPREISACFTGHRQMPPDAMRPAIERVTEEIVRLAEKGITHYYAGGAVGFDLMASVTVLNMKQTIPALTLTLALPCPDHRKDWSRVDRALFERVFARADETVLVNDTYFRGCMQVRNRYMVDRSAVCLAYLKTSRGGTYNTVTYAEKNGVPVIYLAGEPEGSQLHFP